MIRFRPVDAPGETGRPAGQPGRNATAIVQADGTFTLLMDTAAATEQKSGALIGRHQVFFEAPRTKPMPIDSDYIASEQPSEEVLAALRKELDKKYPVYDPLPCGTVIAPSEVEVKPGENTFEFTLSGS